MRNWIFFLIVLCSSCRLLAQQDAWVYLTDKPNVVASIANPISILSQKAIDRKNTQNIPIDARDVPVNEAYISQLKTATGITVKAKSKWFNAVHIRGNETDINNLSASFPFIDYIVFADRNLNSAKSSKDKIQAKFTEALTPFTYGSTANQVQMIKADKLHLSNYTGSGVTVAVLDAGFTSVNTMTSFQRLRNAGNLKGAYDFVDRDTDVYTNTASSHGTHVLSTMAAYIQDQFVGTAPDASYYLFITEDNNSENPVEESFWVEAAERSDSLGVDVINSSLGYTTYDNSNYSYTNADMNGTTAFITKGANVASEKGILVVNSAGNDGNSSWKTVGAPADAPGVFTIGAVNSSGNYAYFSSLGSAVQPTQKPDVVAQGMSSAIISISDAVSSSDGTSFSSPIMAGAIVCLKQALLNKSNAEIMQLVRESASQYATPDYNLGYGIPNFETILNATLGLVDLEIDAHLKLYPNPASHEFYVSLGTDDVVAISVFDVLGQLVFETMATKSNRRISISSLSNGLYIVKLQTLNSLKTIKLIKN